ncbi:LysR substrate-binding domain-containing protein [Saccharospirillum alexandrii]|uniref:LysR substrate-binding domain-containing protein n=1 Tax=Saccharospirillum alexandrii TaxID=2448477 RepID=UPI003735A9E7
MDRRLKFRHIQCFLEAAKSHHLTEVARSLNVTQAAVSKTLTELETIMGMQLILRDRSGLSLTPKGEVFYHYAAAGMESFEKGYEGLVGLSDAPSIELRIGVLPTVAARFMPQAMNTFFAQATQPVNFALQTGYNRHLFDLLHGGKIDLAIARIGVPEMMHELDFIHLYAEPMVLVARAGHPILALPAASRMRAVKDYPFLLAPKDTRIRPIIEQSFATLNIPLPSTLIETVSNTFGRSYLPKSDGLWMISYGVVGDLIEAGVLALVAEPLDSTREPVGLVRRLDQEMPIAMRQLMSILLAQTRELRPLTDSAN